MENKGGEITYIFIVTCNHIPKRNLQNKEKIQVKHTYKAIGQEYTLTAYRYLKTKET